MLSLDASSFCLLGEGVRNCRPDLCWHLYLELALPGTAKQLSMVDCDSVCEQAAQIMPVSLRICCRTSFHAWLDTAGLDETC